MSNYRTKLDHATGLTNIICRTCGAFANCGTIVVHSSGCPFAGDNKPRNLFVKSITRVIHTQVTDGEEIRASEELI